MSPDGDLPDRTSWQAEWRSSVRGSASTLLYFLDRLEDRCGFSAHILLPSFRRPFATKALARRQSQFLIGDVATAACSSPFDLPIHLNMTT